MCKKFKKKHFKRVKKDKTLLMFKLFSMKGILSSTFQTILDSRSTAEVQYNTMQYNEILNSTIKYCTVQYSTIVYSTLLYSKLLYSTLLYSTVQNYTV